MSDHVTVDRLQFTLTVTFHYLFPIVTMGLALYLAYLKTVAYRSRGTERGELYDTAAIFWAKIFAVNFAVGVVTGIPLEFQFGTNWAGFPRFSGGVIGQTLAMEGVFAFFAESVFLGFFLAGRDRISPRLHWISALFVFAGSWLSGFFIIATNAWMQHPVAFDRVGDHLELNSLWGLLTNPWLPWQYLHNMSGAALSGSFIVASVGAFYLLLDRHHAFARICVRVGVIGALIFCSLQIFPTGDRQAHAVFEHQPSAFAAMEGVFETQSGAPLVIIGNQNTERRRLEYNIQLTNFMSFLTSRNWTERVQGLNDIPPNRWPDSVPLVYYAYHIMVGLGTLLLVLAGLAVLLLWRGRLCLVRAGCAVLLLWRGRLYTSRPMLWALMLSVPFTLLANIAGWATAETARQPWLVFGLQRTAAGASPAEAVPAGTGIFTLLGFAGLYLLVGLLYVLLITRIVAQGPEDQEMPTTSTAAAQGA